MSVLCASFVAVETRPCRQGTTLGCAFLSPTIVAQERQRASCSYKNRCAIISHQGESETEKTIVILYHKPPNVITSHSNADALPSHVQHKKRKTVYEDIQSMQGFVNSTPVLESILMRSKLHAIGRLDADTTGLLLITNDGGLVHHATTSPSILKTYEAVIMGHWNDTSPAIVEMKQNGVDIGSNYGGWTRPPRSLVILDHPTYKSTRVELTISEGKNRQVRRMFHAIQSGVMKLKRTRIGDGLTLDGLLEGQWRILTDEQVETHLDWKPRLVVVNSENHGKRRSSRPSGGGVFSTRRRWRRRPNPMA
jgi:pseudouridine synthase